MDWKCLKFGFTWGTLSRNLHMFLNIVKFTVENKKNCLEKTVLKIWFPICEKMALGPQNYF